MARYDHLLVYKASYDLLLEIFRFAKEFKREYKYTIGEKLKNETMELVLLLYRANSKRDKKQTLEEAREKIESIRLMVRLTKDLHLITTKKFVFLNLKIEDVSKQLTAWKKLS